MRKLLFGILLISLLLVTMTAVAEKTNDTNSLADNKTPLPTIRSYFGAIETLGAMASEEAFEYVLTNNTTKKLNFIRI